MTQYDRFQHEQRLLHCWQVTDDLQVLAEGVLEGKLNSDGVANILLGMQQLYALKFDALWDSFEHSINNRG